MVGDQILSLSPAHSRIDRVSGLVVELWHVRATSRLPHALRRGVLESELSSINGARFEKHRTNRAGVQVRISLECYLRLWSYILC
jgi:hypothetical protein